MVSFNKRGLIKPEPFQFEMRPDRPTHGAHQAAVRSDDRAYCYMVGMMDDVHMPYVNVILAHPMHGTPTDPLTDPRLATLKARARALGYGGLVCTFIFAKVADDPGDLAMLRRACIDVVGVPKNDEHLITWGRNAGVNIAAWGDLCEVIQPGRVRLVLSLLWSVNVKVLSFELTGRGGPELSTDPAAPLTDFVP